MNNIELIEDLFSVIITEQDIYFNQDTYLQPSLETLIIRDTFPNSHVTSDTIGYNWYNDCVVEGYIFFEDCQECESEEPQKITDYDSDYYLADKEDN